jgi:DNA repair exonuclease SbcCD nuclease subunit
MARLLHISDTHLLRPGSESEYPELDPYTQLVTVLAAAVLAGPFDAVVLTGDIADDGSREAVLQARKLVLPVAPVVVALPGNHDRTDVGGGVRNRAGTDRSGQLPHPGGACPNGRITTPRCTAQVRPAGRVGAFRDGRSEWPATAELQHAVRSDG